MVHSHIPVEQSMVSAFYVWSVCHFKLTIAFNKQLGRNYQTAVDEACMDRTTFRHSDSRLNDALRELV